MMAWFYRIKKTKQGITIYLRRRRGHGAPSPGTCLYNLALAWIGGKVPEAKPAPEAKPEPEIKQAELW